MESGAVFTGLLLLRGGQATFSCSIDNSKLRNLSLTLNFTSASTSGLESGDPFSPTTFPSPTPPYPLSFDTPCPLLPTSSHPPTSVVHEQLTVLPHFASPRPPPRLTSPHSKVNCSPRSSRQTYRSATVRAVLAFIGTHLIPLVLVRNC